MVKWLIGLLILSPALYGAALFAASEYGGEIVELQTIDERGNSFTTKLWVVELHEEPWLRAGDPEATWVQRLANQPEVVLLRDGERLEYLAEIEEGEVDRVNEAMREKYGLADRIVSTLHDPLTVVAIRLVEPETF